MNEFDIPIFKKAYDLYKIFYGYRSTVPKQDRYAIWTRCEENILDLIQDILLASQQLKLEKLPVLIKASTKLNFLRVFMRLMKENHVIDNKKYVALETPIDEIGRMLGGWIKSTRES